MFWSNLRWLEIGCKRMAWTGTGVGKDKFGKEMHEQYDARKGTERGCTRLETSRRVLG